MRVLVVVLTIFTLSGCMTIGDSWHPGATEQRLQPYQRLPIEEHILFADSFINGERNETTDPEEYKNRAYLFYSLGRRLWPMAGSDYEKRRVYQYAQLATHVTMTQISYEVTYNWEGRATPSSYTTGLVGLPEARLMMWCLHHVDPDAFGPAPDYLTQDVDFDRYLLASQILEDPSKCNEFLP